MGKGKKLGQHFLVNRGVAEKIVHAFLPSTGTIVEIGPGKGILTSELLRTFAPSKIWAVERDRGLCDALIRGFPDRLQVICADILTLDPSVCFPGAGINLISNLPYYVSKDIFEWVIRHHRSIGNCLFLVQREFAAKLLVHTHPESRNAQGIMVNHLFVVSDRFTVQPGSFSPPPAVVSTLISLEKTPAVHDSETGAFYRFLRECFSSRRKTLFNNLRSACNHSRLSDAFSRLLIPSSIRAEELAVDAFWDLFCGLGAGAAE